MLNITFATPGNMNTFWGFVRTLLNFAGPWLMIAVAILAVGILLTVIITAFKNASKDDREENEEYEVKHY